MGQYSGASDEDLFFEVFGLGEKLKACEKAKSVRAPLCFNVDVQIVDVRFTLPNKKEWSWSGSCGGQGE